MNGLPEDVLQKQVVAKFRELEASSGAFTFYAVAGGSVRVPPHIGKRLKDHGCRAGVHDLVFLLDGGKAIFIELKSITGSLEPPQKEWDGIVTSLGFPSYCVKGRTGGEVVLRILEILSAHGLDLNAGVLTMGDIVKKLGK